MKKGKKRKKRREEDAVVSSKRRLRGGDEGDFDLDLDDTPEPEERDEDADDDGAEESKAIVPVEGEVVDGDEDKLTARDAAIVREYVIKGRVIFMQLKWDAQREIDFLSRPSVRAEIKKYETLVDYGEAVMAKQSFLASVELGNMAAEAVNIIKRHLRGLLPDAQGRKQKPEELPDSEQVETAWRILDTLGVGKHMSKQLATAGLTLDLDNPAAAQLDDRERYSMESVLRREKVRNVLAQIANMSASAEDEERKLLEVRTATKERKKKRKVDG